MVFDRSASKYDPAAQRIVAGLDGTRRPATVPRNEAPQLGDLAFAAGTPGSYPAPDVTPKRSQVPFEPDENLRKDAPCERTAVGAALYRDPTYIYLAQIGCKTFCPLTLECAVQTVVEVRQSGVDSLDGVLVRGGLVVAQLVERIEQNT